MKTYISTLLLFVLSLGLYAQSPNDECGTAIEITDIDNWCSAVGAYSNTDATASNFPASSCASNVSHDVWFSFIAEARDVNVTVVGNTPGGNSGGTLNAADVSIHTGNCNGTLNELECATDGSSNGILELYQGDLTVGQTYYIRVDGRGNGTGSFQLCVNNFNLPVLPGSDCATRAFLCDKSSFTVQSVVGSGSSNETNSTCIGGESNSTWFAWTCGTAGTLDFTLTPTNLSDDLDFVVYELPNGVNDCSGKTIVRCMAASCLSATGLRSSSNDTTEPPGCQGGNDSWLRSLDMAAGTSYALVINNFTSTGNGFSMTFGGTGTFQGPEARFTTDDSDNTVCIGNSITLTDASTSSVGSIVGYSWNFGVGASPSTASGIGPHTINYSSTGTKSVALTVENSFGCIVTEVTNIQVDACCQTDNAMAISSIINDLECFDDPNGSIDLSISSPFPISSTQWDTGANTEDINGLTGGDYMVTITNQYCDSIITYTVPSPPPFTFDTIMTFATCNGGSDGALTLNVTGATPPFLFDWNDGNGLQSNNQLTGLPIGFYNVTVQDANGCEQDLTLEVTELELELDPDIIADTPPSCFGFSDGSIVLNIDNGLPPYQFDWNDGMGFVSDNSLENIAAGTYTIEVLDANGCRGQFSFNIEDPALLTIDLDSIDVSCFGEADGEIVPLVSGGVGGYQYNWSDGQTDSIAMGLIAGNYSVTVLDANSCVVSDAIEVVQPPELAIIGVDVIDVVCFGDSTGTITITPFGGNPPYMYSYDGVNFQADSILQNVQAGSYTVYVMDALGCTDTDNAFINQPPQLQAFAGEDLEVNLGYSIDIDGSHSPPNKPVTIEWTPALGLSCTDCFTPTANPVNTTTYVLTITDETGCVGVDSMVLNVNKVRPVYFPSAFSPNEDGVNDIFTAFAGPATRQIKNLKVFDRWGGLIYEGNNLQVSDFAPEGWNGESNGKPLNNGVFVYLAEIEFVDGVVQTYSGDITLVR